MLEIDQTIQPAALSDSLERMWQVSAQKILSIEQACAPETGTPVFTVDGRYTSQGWTEWTQGFQFGSSILQFDATGDEQWDCHGPLRKPIIVFGLSAHDNKSIRAGQGAARSITQLSRSAYSATAI